MTSNDPTSSSTSKLKVQEKTAALAKVAVHAPNIIVPLRFFSEDISGLRPLNMEQTFVLQALLDENDQLVSLRNVAGTGKNFSCSGRPASGSA